MHYICQVRKADWKRNRLNVLLIFCQEVFWGSNSNVRATRGIARNMADSDYHNKSHSALGTG